MTEIITENAMLPYEKFRLLGPGALTEAELLAIILRTGVRNCPATELAQKVLSLAKGKYRGLNSLPSYLPCRAYGNSGNRRGEGSQNQVSGGACGSDGEREGGCVPSI